MALAHCSRGQRRRGWSRLERRHEKRIRRRSIPDCIGCSPLDFLLLFFSHFLTITSSFVWFASYPCYLSSSSSPTYEQSRLSQSIVRSSTSSLHSLLVPQLSPSASLCFRLAHPKYQTARRIVRSTLHSNICHSHSHHQGHRRRFAVEECVAVGAVFSFALTGPTSIPTAARRSSSLSTQEPPGSSSKGRLKPSLQRQNLVVSSFFLSHVFPFYLLDLSILPIRSPS